MAEAEPRAMPAVLWLVVAALLGLILWFSGFPWGLF
jgi:hypothetical protein